MGSNTWHKRCPRCKRKRKYTVPPNHNSPGVKVWEKRDNQWICPWCIARETPDGEAELRKDIKTHAENRHNRVDKQLDEPMKMIWQGQPVTVTHVIMTWDGKNRNRITLADGTVKVVGHRTLKFSVKDLFPHEPGV